MTPTTPAGSQDARPTRPTLSREYIVSTALALVDRDGLERFSMRRLGAELRVDPMAVYHYFPTKADLFDGIVEAVYLEIAPPPGVVGMPWKDSMAEMFGAVRAALRKHPAALPAMATRPISSQAVLELIEQPIARLVAAGAPPAAALDAVNGLFVFTTGHALAEMGEPVGGPDNPGPDLERLDLSRLPTFVAAFEAGYAYDPDAQYELTLMSMLAGFGERLHLHD